MAVNLERIGSPTPTRIKLLRATWSLFQLPFLPHTPRLLSPLRILLLRLFGAKVNSSNLICGGVKVWCPWNLELGHASAIGYGVELYNFAPIRIGDNTVVSQYSYLCTSTHDYTNPLYPLVNKQIEIGSQVWLAADVFVAPGVSVGEGAVVGARSVVTRNVRPWTVSAGNPCREIKERVLTESE